jgi:hypothetical protein
MSGHRITLQSFIHDCVASRLFGYKIFMLRHEVNELLYDAEHVTFKWTVFGVPLSVTLRAIAL